MIQLFIMILYHEQFLPSDKYGQTIFIKLYVELSFENDKCFSVMLLFVLIFKVKFVGTAIIIWCWVWILVLISWVD